MFEDFSRPLLFAHRGASRRAPENTLAAFDLGLRLGAQVLEMDVHLTRDQEVVVFHDAKLERTTNGHGPIADHSYAQLEALDAGFNFLLHNEPIFRGRGLTIPRLEDVFTAFPKAGFNIELKSPEPNLITRVLSILKMVKPSQVILAAANDNIMTALQAAKPDCALGLSYSQVKSVVKSVFTGESLEKFRGRALQIPIRHPAWFLGLTPIPSKCLIKRVHSAGLEIHVYTIDNPRLATRFLKRQVDAIMSDDPGEILSAFPKIDRTIV